MSRDLFERHAVVRLLVYAAAIIAVLYAASMLWGIVAHFANIILVLFLAWIIVFILQPVAAWLERIRAPRLLAVALVYLALLALVIGAIVLAVPTISAQVAHLAPMLAGLFSLGNIQALGEWATRLLQGFGLSPRDAQSIVNQAGQQIQTWAGGLATQSVTAAEALFGQVVTLIFNATVIIVLSFYMMLDGAAFVERLVKRLPPAWIPDVRLFQNHVNTIFGGFLRAALVICLTYAVLNWVILAGFGQPAAVLFALLAGILLVVPWIGGFLAIIPPALLVLLNSPSSAALRNVIILVIALIIAQQVTMQIVAPRVIGSYVGLHPLLVFAALLIGATEAGVWGLLFGPPIAAVLVAMLDTFFERWQRTSGKYPDLSADKTSDQAKPEKPEKPPAGSEPPATEGKRLVESPS